MEFTIPKNKQFECSSSNPLFVGNIVVLLKTTEIYLSNMKEENNVSVNTVSKFGDFCQYILNINIDNDRGDLNDDSIYKNIFIGEHSEKFIEVLKLVQILSRLSWKLDTYPTLELIDNGVRKADQLDFSNSINLLHNKLLLLEKATKNREQ